jgi:hypothetical protein
MVGKKLGLLLILMSFWIDCAAKDEGIDNSVYRVKGWYIAPRNSTEQADSVFSAHLQRLTSAHVSLFSNDKVLQHLPDDEHIKGWLLTLQDAVTFIHKQHEKLDVEVNQAIELWKNFLKNIVLIRMHVERGEIATVLSNPEWIETFEEYKKALPELYTKVNTSGPSLFKTTKRARHLAAAIILLLETTIDRVIKELKGATLSK